MFKAMAKVDAKKEFDTKPQFGKKPAKDKVQAAADEMKANPPAILAKTAKKSGAKQAAKQKIAIMLAKARRGA